LNDLKCPHRRVGFVQRTGIDGPFTETNELVAGFWLWQVKSMEEAVEWVRRCPNPMEGDSEIEIRPLRNRRPADFLLSLPPCASQPGEQLIRLLFDEPRDLRRIWLGFSEPNVERTQQFTLRWTGSQTGPFREIVRSNGTLIREV
jgi:YCII-related domain